MLLGTICIKHLMYLIFLTLSGEIIKLEQPKLKWCLFGTNKKNIFQTFPFGSVFKNLIIKYIFDCKSYQSRRHYSSTFGQTKLMNRVILCAEDVLSGVFFFQYQFIPVPWKDWKKTQIDMISFIAFIMQKLRK